MFYQGDIIGIHLEPTSKCNAKCPQCPRNVFGSSHLLDNLQEEDFPIELLDQIDIPVLNDVLINGNYGDIVMHSKPKEFIEEIMNGKPRVQRKVIAKKPQIGRVNGLYATESGMGGITIIEVMNTPCDKKRLCIEELTGSQGDVMKESMRCALTLVSNLLPDEVKKEIKEFGLHIHCPEAATPKDGPSAGIGMVTSIVSSITNIPVRRDVAMTGEVTLTGQVLPIGGLKEKLLAAHRAGIKEVLIPKENEKDLVDMPKKIVDEIKITPVEFADEVLKIALTKELKKTEWVEVDISKKDDKSQASIQ